MDAVRRPGETRVNALRTRAPLRSARAGDTVLGMNASEHDFISSEVTTNFGKNLRQSQVDPARLREAIASAVAATADDAAVTALREMGGHYFLSLIHI